MRNKILGAVLLLTVAILFQNCGGAPEVAFSSGELTAVSASAEAETDQSGGSGEQDPSVPSYACPSDGVTIYICYSTNDGISKTNALAHCKQNAASNPRTPITCLYDGSVLFARK